MNKELRLFTDFLSSPGNDSCDLSFLESPEQWLNSLLGQNANRFFRIYFRNKASDLCGEWDKTGKFNEEERLPFVWLSSEGTPQTIIAKDTTEFLSLLPYGVNILTGVPEILKRFEQNPNDVIPPEEMYSQAVISESYSYQSTHFSGHKSMVTFITRTLGIELSTTPFETIRRTVNSFPDLEKWIEMNLNP